jgi:hypothetical protein
MVTYRLQYSGVLATEVKIRGLCRLFDQPGVSPPLLLPRSEASLLDRHFIQVFKKVSRIRTFAPVQLSARTKGTEINYGHATRDRITIQKQNQEKWIQKENRRDKGDQEPCSRHRQGTIVSVSTPESQLGTCVPCRVEYVLGTITGSGLDCLFPSTIQGPRSCCFLFLLDATTEPI